MAVVGKPEVKVDAVRLAKGNPAFTDDIEPRGMLYAKVLRSPHAHARILSIDDSKARAVPGVHAVLHHGNTPRVKYASGGQSWPNPHPYDQVSFDDRVRHVGDRVAAVAAETVEAAEEAVRLIEVTYEVLPAVYDERFAMDADAPKVHDEDDTTHICDPERNLVHHITAQRGDVDGNLAIGAHAFEQTFRVHQVQQCPIEPHISMAWLDSDERMVVRTATQVPFHTRRMLAPLIDMDIKDIRVIKPRIGGGFGAKQEMLIEDIVAHLAIATRRPVRLELDRAEEFYASRTRHPQTITFRTAVDDDGGLLAQDMAIIGNTGPYGTHGFTVQIVSGLRGLTSYNAASKRFDCHVVYTNIPVPGAYRGYGAPQAEFALEAHMEDIARTLDLDPIEFKRRNWVKVGDEMDIAPHLGERAVEEEELDEYPKVMSSGIEECVAQGMREIDWSRRGDAAWKAPADRPNIRRGIGFAFCMHGTAIPFLDMGGCSIKLNDDGSFNMLIGATDLGTGADTVIGQIAAEVLGVPLDDIKVYSSDTDMTPFDTGAYASSTTYISGTAALRAAEAVRERLKARAAMLLEVDEPCTIELRDRRAYAADGRSVTLEEIALDSLHWQEQEQIMGTASHVSPDCPPPFAAQFAEVDVDVDTGQVTVTKLVMHGGQRPVRSQGGGRDSQGRRGPGRAQRHPRRHRRGHQRSALHPGAGLGRPASPGSGRGGRRLRGPAGRRANPVHTGGAESDFFRPWTTGANPVHTGGAMARAAARRGQPQASAREVFAVFHHRINGDPHKRSAAGVGEGSVRLIAAALQGLVHRGPHPRDGRIPCGVFRRDEVDGDDSRRVEPVGLLDELRHAVQWYVGADMLGDDPGECHEAGERLEGRDLIDERRDHAPLTGHAVPVGAPGP